MPNKSKKEKRARKAAEKLGPTERKAAELAKNTAYFHGREEKTHPIYNHMLSLLGEKKVGKIDLGKKKPPQSTAGGNLGDALKRAGVKKTKPRDPSSKTGSMKGTWVDPVPVNSSTHPVYSKMAKLLGEKSEEEEREEDERADSDMRWKKEGGGKLPSTPKWTYRKNPRDWLHTLKHNLRRRREINQGLRRK